MLKMAQLKYPSFPTKVSLQQATVSFPLPHVHQSSWQFMTHETCYFSSNYDSELRSLEDPVNMANMTQVVQFPYTVAVGHARFIAGSAD